MEFTSGVDGTPGSCHVTIVDELLGEAVLEAAAVAAVREVAIKFAPVTDEMLAVKILLSKCGLVQV